MLVLWFYFLKSFLWRVWNCNFCFACLYHCVKWVALAQHSKILFRKFTTTWRPFVLTCILYEVNMMKRQNILRPKHSLLVNSSWAYAMVIRYETKLRCLFVNISNLSVFQCKNINITFMFPLANFNAWAYLWEWNLTFFGTLFGWL